MLIELYQHQPEFIYMIIDHLGGNIKDITNLLFVSRIFRTFLKGVRQGVTFVGVSSADLPWTIIRQFIIVNGKIMKHGIERYYLTFSNYSYLSRECFMKYGKYHGPFRTWTLSNKKRLLIVEGTYFEGKLHGLYKEYRNGNLYKTTNYDMGKRTWK